MNALLMFSGIFSVAFLAAYAVYRRARNVYPFIAVSGAGLFSLIALTVKYSYDVFLLPGPAHDGIPITAVMRLLSGDDSFYGLWDKFSGIFNGGVLIVMLAAVLAVCLLKLRRGESTRRKILD